MCNVPNVCMAKIMSCSKLIILNGIVLFRTDINKTKRYQGQLRSIVMVNVVLKIILLPTHC